MFCYICPIIIKWGVEVGRGRVSVTKVPFWKVVMQERHFNFFLGDQIFLIFQCHRTYWKIGKKNFTCA